MSALKRAVARFLNVLDGVAVKNGPLFSVVLPSLNQGAFIEAALQSLFAQQAGDLEILVADAGSTDQTLAVIRRYGHLIDWWRSEPDRGQSDALNEGFARARGKFLFWLNADDVLLPGALDAVRAAVRENPRSEWFAGNLVYLDREGRVIRCAVDKHWHSFLFRFLPVRVYGPGSFFTKRLFEKSGGFDLSLHYMMDTDLWMRMKGGGARFEKVDRYLWGFRVHGGSKTSADLAGKAPLKMAAERELLLKRYRLRHVGWWNVLMRGARLLDGSYLRAWGDSKRMSGRNWRDVI